MSHMYCALVQDIFQLSLVFAGCDGNCVVCFAGIGVAMVIVSGLVGIYYNMIIAWAIYYLFASFSSKLPWEDCEEDFAGDCKSLPPPPFPCLLLPL